MDSGPRTKIDGRSGWPDRLKYLIETAHNGLVDLALDAVADADLACTLGAVDLRDVLDDLRRHDSQFPRRRVRWGPSDEPSRWPDHGLPAVGGVLSYALGLVVTTAHDDVGLSSDELLLLARVAHGLARVLDRLGISRP